MAANGRDSETVIIALLRAVNLPGQNRVGMAALRAVHESLGLRDVQTYLQSGNVVFRVQPREVAGLSRRIQSGVAKEFGFGAEVILRTASELRDVMARNPFAGRRDVEASKLVVAFLAGEPAASAREHGLRLPAHAEELRLDGRELYIHYREGISRSKLTVARIEKALGVPATGRNWNTVTELLRMAERREAS